MSNEPTRLSGPEVTTIHSGLKSALSALVACGQDDLANEVRSILVRVAARAFPGVKTATAEVAASLMTPDELQTMENTYHADRNPS